MINYIVQSFNNKNLQQLNNWLKLISELNSGQTWLVDEKGYLFLSYPSTIIDKEQKIKFLEVDAIMNGKIISKRIESAYFERPMLLVGVPIRHPESNKINGGLLFFTPVAGINSTIEHVKRIMLYSSLLAIFLAILIAYRWSKSLSAPLKSMNEVAIQLSEGNFGKEINIEDDSEIGTLAESINYLSRKLEITIDDLVQERNKLKYVLSGMEEGVLVINREYKIILGNESIKELLDIKKSLITQNINEVIKEEKIKKTFLDSLHNGEAYKEEFSINNNDISKRILMNCTPIYIEEDQLWGVVGLFEDISERWRFEQLQKEFVANVSHELKTPLSAIKGSTEVLIDGVVSTPEKKNNYLKIILDEANRLSELVDKILDLAELDASTLDFKFEKLNAVKLIEDIALIFNKSLERENEILKVEKADKPIYIRANEEKIKQVLLNLLDNAYKFSQKDKKIILGLNEEKGKVKFWVKDQGVGIPGDKLDDIWERFFKVDKARTPNERSGSGLGLAIVKQIIKKHGGEVFVKSKVGIGSTFGFYLKKY
jgi:signal transduction histidine kinase